MKKSLGAAAVVFASLVLLETVLGLPVGPAPASLAKKIDALLGKPGLKKVLFSVRVVSCETGETVYARNPGLALMPASNMKIVTSAAAMEILGPDFAFATKVGLCGDALVVMGSGDPLLGDKETDARNGNRSRPFLQDIASRLKENGIGTVSEILLDTSVFDGERVHPGWPKDQLHQKYACEVSGINYNGNCVDITATRLNGRVVLSQTPANDYVRLVNAVTPGWKRKNWFSVERTETPNRLLIQGTCRTQAGPYSVAVENPALFFGRILRETLLKEGISVGGDVSEQIVPQDREFLMIAEHRTSLGDCLRRTNKDSLGLAAEALFKTLGARQNPGGIRGGWESGRLRVEEYLKGFGVDEREFVIADGSGLSRANRLSAGVLAGVLLHLSATPHWDFFKNSLAVGGLDGTIENNFGEKKYRGRVLAKSGYIQAVRALSGVVRTDQGDYIFSFLANKAGNGARSAIDAAVKAIVDWGARPALPGKKR